MPQHLSPPTVDQLHTEVYFQEPSNQGLKIPKGINPERWATHLAYLSAREPANLTNHVRRIYLHLKLKQPDALYGAMLDLHLVLGDKGGSLRGSLLRKAKNLLAKKHYNLFRSHNTQGLRRTQLLPASQHSVLGNFFSGGRNLVSELKTQSKPSEKGVDPLELAREELNYGDIAVAQQILEQALLQSPKRLGLHFGLLEVYKHTRSLDDLLNMKEQLGDGVAIAQAAWNQTQRLLETRDS